MVERVGEHYLLGSKTTCSPPDIHKMRHPAPLPPPGGFGTGVPHLCSMEAALALMENILEVFARNLLMLIDELIFERAVLCFIFVFNGGGAFENFTHIRAGGGVKFGEENIR